MAKSGCVVTSIDLAARQRSDRQYFPVIDYDGEQLPFSENSFDVVYSSNVLEHVERLEVTLAEIQRVLRKHGIAIHVLPTPTWRIWTSLTHYPFLCKLIAGRIGLLVSKDGTRRSQSATRSKSVAQIAQQKGSLYVVRRALYAGSHGVYPNAFQNCTISVSNAGDKSSSNLALRLHRSIRPESSTQDTRLYLICR